MGELLSKIVEMSVMGSVVILITMLARFLLRKRSKRFIMILWAVVAMRLLVPISIESSLSIFNYLPLKTNTVSTIAQIQDADLPDLFSDPQALTAEDAGDDMVIPDIDELLPPEESAPSGMRYRKHHISEKKKDDRPAILAFFCAILAAVGLSALFVSRMNRED